MSLIMDSWYAGAWSSEVGDGPVGRTILKQPVVFFRPGEGEIAALLDICPHRAVPLHLGSVAADRIKCPYHGIEFDRAGTCRFNPHIKGPPDRLTVRAFPVVERYGVVWIWPGDPDLADPATIPDYTLFDSPERYAVGRGYTHVEADYRLVIDNLMDLTHAEYLHLATVGTPGASEVLQTNVERDGDDITIKYFLPDMPPAALFANGWTMSERVDQYSNMTWRAASNLSLNLGIMPPGAERSAGWHVPSAHLLTPEDEENTHYFWAFARDFDIENDELTAGIVAVGKQAFTTEDKPMIEQAQKLLKNTSTKLVNFSIGDSASAQVRRALDRLASPVTTREEEAVG